VSLLEWFLENRDGSEVTGFAHHRWNGVTTLQYARLLESIILSKGLYERLLATSHVHHFVPNTVVTKAELLGLMNEAFNRKIAVRPVTDVGPPIDRTISTRFGLLGAVFPSNDMGDAIEDLAHFMRTATAQP
jgi:dTDP-4-dehydrorhamnose reductase